MASITKSIAEAVKDDPNIIWRERSDGARWGLLRGPISVKQFMGKDKYLRAPTRRYLKTADGVVLQTQYRDGVPDQGKYAANVYPFASYLERDWFNICEGTTPVECHSTRVEGQFGVRSRWICTCGAHGTWTADDLKIEERRLAHQLTHG